MLLESGGMQAAGEACSKQAGAGWLQAAVLPAEAGGLLLGTTRVWPATGGCTPIQQTVSCRLSASLSSPGPSALQTDPAWPGPCYGAVPAVPLSPEAAAGVVSLLREAFANVKL